MSANPPKAGRPAHILIVEDEPVTRKTLASYLDSFGYRISEGDTAEEAEHILAHDPPDLLLVDINLSGRDGLEITRNLRARSEIGIILISGRTDELDRIIGLELGADDYVCKPFNRRELLARIKNLLRRTQALRQLERKSLRFEGFGFDLATRALSGPDGAAIPLTRAEYEMLRLFVTSPGRVLDRDRLAAAIATRRGGVNIRSVDVLVRRLRAKLGDDPRQPRILATAHGEGYLFTAALD
ncbi:response regulator [Xinfangfangia sp. D13-10-4-6]|uniref:response regulator n=1 Tax=Pseudogemmobacter hezensis TaxID=2737662 RepID=UPI00155827B8|nr:response regulator [Pseudogemmobacter hezensis]NPD14789.1 response regulator [Pseudogemmobacter hezensis]